MDSIHTSPDTLKTSPYPTSLDAQHWFPEPLKVHWEPLALRNTIQTNVIDNVAYTDTDRRPYPTADTQSARRDCLFARTLTRQKTNIIIDTLQEAYAALTGIRDHFSTQQHVDHAKAVTSVSRLTRQLRSIITEHDHDVPTANRVSISVVTTGNRQSPTANR